MSRLPPFPLIYLITAGDLTGENYSDRAPALLRLIESAASAGIPLVQLREKRLSAKLLFELAMSAAQRLKGSRTRLLVNDRADVALAAGADGVHLASTSYPPSAVRKSFPADFLIGASVHTIMALNSVRSDGADFAVFGPIFETPGKARPLGIDGLRLAVDGASGFPVLALGGVNDSNYRNVLEIGAAGFAAIRFLNSEANLKRISEELKLTRK